MRLLLTLFILSFLFLSHAEAQKILQLEKYGSFKTRRYFLGSDITYKLKGDNAWYNGEVQNIIVEDDILLLQNRYVKLPQIEAIRSFHNREKGAKLGYSLYIFGTSWSVFALGGAISNPDFSYRKADAIVTASAFALGFAITQLFKSKTYKIGKKRRLRLLDITARPN